MDAVKTREKQNTQMKPGHKKDNLCAYLMATPTIILFLMFCAYPIVFILIKSFYESDGLTVNRWVGISNYVRMMSDRSWWSTVLNTVQFGFLIPLVQIPLALLLAVILNGKLKHKSFLRTVLFLPNITSTAIMGIIFYFMFSSYNGIVNQALMKLGLIKTPIEWLGKEGTAKFVIILFSAWAHVGFYMVLFLSALQRIPREVYESASVDGANSFQTLIKITIPMLGDMFRTIVMLSILSAMKLFDTIKVLTGGAPGNKTEVMTMYIYRYYFEPANGKLQQGYASTVGVASLIITGIVALIYLRLSRRSSDAEGGY
jgi:raffinose/stachyose/melibiose transport system permease protein